MHKKFGLNKCEEKLTVFLNWKGHLAGNVRHVEELIPLVSGGRGKYVVKIAKKK